jgi:hypothetical protein
MSKVSDLLKMDGVCSDEEETSPVEAEAVPAKKRGRPRKPVAVEPVVEHPLPPAPQEACLLMRLEAWGQFIKAIEGLPFKEVKPVFEAMEALWVPGQSVTLNADPAIFTPKAEG